MGCNCLWPYPPTEIHLGNRDVHVWCAVLTQPNVIVSRLAQLLSQDEHERASRFVFDKDRRQFIVGRGLLRKILGNYLAKDPTQIRLEYGPHGKPALAKSFQLSFNLSHSHGLAVYAVTRQHKVGIDLEVIRPLEDMTNLAQRFFSTAEFEAFSSLSAEDRQAGFFAGWTRKEAFIKAIGTGLSHPLHEFDVSLLPNRPAELLRVNNDPDALRRWSLSALFPSHDYVGALCVERHNCRVSLWQLPTDE